MEVMADSVKFCFLVKRVMPWARNISFGIAGWVGGGPAKKRDVFRIKHANSFFWGKKQNCDCSPQKKLT